MTDEYESQFNCNDNSIQDETDALNEDNKNLRASDYEQPGVSTIPEHRYVTYIPYGFTPKTFEEKKAIKKTAMMIGLALVIMLAVSELWSFAYLFIMKLNGYTAQKALEVIYEPAIMQVLQIVLSSLMFLIPFTIIYKSFGNRISDLVPLGRPQKGRALPFFLFGISFCAFANIAVSQASTIFQRFGINYNVDFGDNPKGFFGFLLSLIATAIVPPLIEEFACRGLILGALRKYGDGFAVIVSSVLFGLMHGNFEQIPFAFLVGLILGYIVIKTGSLWIAISVHAFNNFISIFFEYAMSNVESNVQNVIYAVFLTVCILVGIIAIILFSNQDNSYYYFDKSETESTEKQKFKWFFTSVLIIIFTVVSFITAFSYFVL